MLAFQVSAKTGREQAQQTAARSDHLVGAAEQRNWRNVNPSVFAVLRLMVQLVRAEGATRKWARPARSMAR